MKIILLVLDYGAGLINGYLPKIKKSNNFSNFHSFRISQKYRFLAIDRFVLFDLVSSVTERK
jgi:hypothetical protein